jgi:hypothetical protein
VRLTLGDFCQARAGDKADIVNVAVFAPDPATFDLLLVHVTEDVVAAHFAPLVDGGVTRYVVPNVLALNFVCRRALGGGGPRTLRSDMLGKTFGPNLLRLEVDVPDELAADLRRLKPPDSGA